MVFFIEHIFEKENFALTTTTDIQLDVNRWGGTIAYIEKGKTGFLLLKDIYGIWLWKDIFRIWVSKVTKISKLRGKGGHERVREFKGSREREGLSDRVLLCQQSTDGQRYWQVVAVCHGFTIFSGFVHARGWARVILCH